jgi:hypothetical protein
MGQGLPVRSADHSVSSTPSNRKSPPDQSLITHQMSNVHPSSAGPLPADGMMHRRESSVCAAFAKVLATRPRTQFRGNERFDLEQTGYGLRLRRHGRSRAYCGMKFVQRWLCRHVGPYPATRGSHSAISGNSMTRISAISCRPIHGQHDAKISSMVTSGGATPLRKKQAPPNGGER